MDVEKNLSKKNIPFFLLTGSPEDEIPGSIKKYKVSALIADFNPLRIKRNWEDVSQLSFISYLLTLIARGIQRCAVEVDDFHTVVCIGMFS